MDDLRRRPRTPARPHAAGGREPSHAARALAEWAQAAGHVLRLARAFGADAPQVRPGRERLIAGLAEMVARHAPLAIRVTERALGLGAEPAFAADEDDVESWQRDLPFALHRDGIRGLRFEAGTTRGEAATFVGALLELAAASLTDEDLATRLWEARLPHVVVETVALEEAAAFGTPAPAAAAPGAPAGAIGPAPAAEPVAALAPATRPRFDDWFVPGEAASPAAQLWRETAFGAEAATAPFVARWRAEAAEPFPQRVEGFIDELRDLDPRRDTRDTFAASTVTWIASAVQRCEWEEALHAFAVLRSLDPTGGVADEPLAAAFASLDIAAIAERLDESARGDQARFFALVVRAGAPALDLVIGVLARSGRQRLRAGATTALGYACADEPGALGRYLADSRWYVVRNVVFALGQIGGDAVVPLLAVACRHVDTRVRRAAVQALGHVRPELRVPLLLTQLDTVDRPLLQSALALLARERDARVAQALLDRVMAADFEARPLEVRLTLLGALADVADERAVPALEQLLARGGWFARRSPERSAAARTLARIGGEQARAALAAGLRHRSEAVREACAQALAPGEPS